MRFGLAVAMASVVTAICAVTALAEPVVPGCKVVALGQNKPYMDIAFIPSGGSVMPTQIAVAIASPTRWPCDSYIASISIYDGAESIFAAPCVDLPVVLDFYNNDPNQLYFAEGALSENSIYITGPLPDSITIPFLLYGLSGVRDLIFGPDLSAELGTGKYLYVTDYNLSSIIKYSETGIGYNVSGGYSKRDWGGPTPNWITIAFNQAGELFVGDDFNGTIYTVSTKSLSDSKTPFVTNVGQVSGMNFALDGTLFASVWGTQGRGKILAISPDKTTSVFGSGFNNPCRIQVAEDGSIFLLEWPNWSWANGLDLGRTLLRISPQIDIKPDNSENKYRPNSLITVQTFGSKILDVSDVNVSTISLNSASGGSIPVKTSKNGYAVTYGDFNADGFLDMSTDHQNVPGIFPSGQSEATLSGIRSDGRPFYGEDLIFIFITK